MEAAPSTTLDVKRLNLRRVLRHLFHTGPTSRVDIAAALGMSMPTVLTNVRGLMERGLAAEAGQYGSTGGRRATVIAGVGSARLALGVDITREDAGFALVDLSGALLRHRRVPRAYRDEADYYAWLRREAGLFLATEPGSGDKLLGTGVAVAGILDADGTRIVRSHTLGVRDVDCAQFRAALPGPCLFWNDANAAGFAEVADGGDGRSLAYLSLSGTVGGALFWDGRLWRGSAERCGEFGHMRLVPGGRKCYCGQDGCADAYLSASRLSGMAGGLLSSFFSGLEQGESSFRSAWEAYLEHLALAVVNLRLALDCDVVVGGYVGGYLEPYLDDLRRRVRDLDPFRDSASCVTACRFRWEASAYGAAMGHVERFFETL